MAAVEKMVNLQFLQGEPYETLVSKQVLCTMLVGYLLMIVSLRWFMKGRKPFTLKGPMLVCPLPHRPCPPAYTNPSARQSGGTLSGP